MKVQKLSPRRVNNISGLKKILWKSTLELVIVSILLKKEYISIIIYSPNHINALVSDPRQLWKLL